MGVGLMGLLDFIRGKKIPADRAQVIFDETTVRTADKLKVYHRPRDHEAQALLDRAWGTVHQCASGNADVCARMPLRLMRRVDATDASERRLVRGHKIAKHKRLVGKAGVYSVQANETEEVRDHPILDMLNRPNPWMNGMAMARNRFYFKEITGKAFGMLGWGSGGYPISMYPLLPQFVLLNIDDDGGLVGYVYGRSDTEWIELDLDDVAYFRHTESRFNPYEGEGPLAGVVPIAEILTQTAMHDLAFVQRGYRPDSMVSLPAGTPPEIAKQVEREINSKGGSISGSKAHVTSGEVKVEPIAWPPKELQTEAQLERYERQVRLAFGHTDSMAQGNDSTYASALVGYDLQYMGGAITYRLERDAAELCQLLPYFGLDPDAYFFAYDDPVKRDVETLSQRMDILARGGIVSINEARAELGYDPADDENADKLMVNGVPLGEIAGGGDGFGGFSIPGQFLSANNEQKQVTTDNKQRGPDTTSIQILDLVKSAELPEWQDCRCGHSTKDDDDDIAADPLLRQVFREYRDELEPAFRDILTDMQDEVIRAEREGVTPNLGPLRDQAARELGESMRGIVDLAMEDVRALAEQNGRDPFNVRPESALRFLESHVIRVADDIADTTEQIIRPAIRRGLEEGLSIDDIAGEIEEAGIPEYRAERIARTEMSTAANGARYEGWRDIGVSKVEWRTAPGATTAHQMIAARSPKPLGEPFVKAGETLGKETFTRDVYTPPARPNCRCTAVAVFDDEGDEE